MDAMHECQVCGEMHDEEEHGDAIVVLQPSLHTVDEFNVEAIEEMAWLEPENKEIQGLYKEYGLLATSDDPDSEAYQQWADYVQEICDDMMQALEHPYYFGEDTFLIYAK